MTETRTDDEVYGPWIRRLESMTGRTRHDRTTCTVMDLIEDLYTSRSGGILFGIDRRGTDTVG